MILLSSLVFAKLKLVQLHHKVCEGVQLALGLQSPSSKALKHHQGRGQLQEVRGLVKYRLAHLVLELLTQGTRNLWLGLSSLVQTCEVLELSELVGCHLNQLRLVCTRLLLGGFALLLEVLLELLLGDSTEDLLHLLVLVDQHYHRKTVYAKESHVGDGHHKLPKLGEVLRTGELEHQQRVQRLARLVS